MYITANHSNHMNIVESRKLAVKKMSKRTGLTFHLSGNKTPKSHVVMAIKSGYLDGFFYSVDFDAKTVKIMARWDDLANSNFVYKIGN